MWWLKLIVALILRCKCVKVVCTVSFLNANCIKYKLKKLFMIRKPWPTSFIPFVREAKSETHNSDYVSHNSVSMYATKRL